MRQIIKTKNLFFALARMDSTTVRYVAKSESYRNHEIKCAIVTCYIMGMLSIFAFSLLYLLDYAKHNN